MFNGFSFRNAVISGSNNIRNSKEEINAMNIFPVPDGDTGTNMSMTIMSGIEDVPQSESISEVSDMIASAMLKGARGNSGVILSVIFKGIAKGLKELPEATGKDIVKALEIGINDAYGTITNPTEGTILTVARIAYEDGLKACEESNDAVYVWSEVCKGAKRALDMTPDLLPVLKRAKVVDAGGKGLLLIFEGMLSVFKDGRIIEAVENSNSEQLSKFDDKFKRATEKFDEKITFTYCTEFIVEKLDSVSSDVKAMKSFLESIGDCALVVSDDDVIKVHVHTDNPGLALQYGLKFGQLLTVKIDNMKEQNRQKTIEKDSEEEQLEKYEYAEPTEEYGFVCVSAGDGLKRVFEDLGCTYVVSGGQTMNPSTNDVLLAVKATPAKTVYVLPNNKNIILSAKQTASLVDDREVVVVETKTIPQGISALLAFNPESDVEENLTNMYVATRNVATGLVTFAARDSKFNGLKIKKGDTIALEDGMLVLAEKDPVKALYKLMKKMVTSNSSYVTVAYGKNVTEEQVQKATDLLDSKFGKNTELTVIDGGQPVYYFIVSVE